MWDFWSLSPESLHQVTTLFSDRGLPTDVRHINGYGSHTYSLINAEGERVWVKFHFKTQQGHRHWTNDQAVEVVGKTRESTQEDLYAAIENGDYPRWTVQVQVMTDAQADEWSARTGWNPFDLTKVWPHGDFPVIEIGSGTPPIPATLAEIVTRGDVARLHRAGLASLRQDASRTLSAMPTARYAWYALQALPVHAPRCPVTTTQDGAMRFFEPRPAT